jgi:hypothetical protein
MVSLSLFIYQDDDETVLLINANNHRTQSFLFSNYAKHEFNVNTMSVKVRRRTRDYLGYSKYQSSLTRKILPLRRRSIVVDSRISV